MSFTLILIMIIALLTAAIFAVNSIGGAMHRRELKKERERGKQRERKTAQVYEQAARQNERMETGSSVDDFNNSIGVMSELAGKNKHDKPPDSSRPDSKRGKRRNV